FQVTDNEIISVKAKNKARVKENTSFKVNTCLFSKYIANTDGDIRWEYKAEGDSAYITSKVIGKECIFTFNKKGNYFVRAYINEASKCTPFKIKIGEAKVLKSSWIDEDGYAYGNDTANYKISKAGLDQQVYAYAQLEEVANEKVTLEIWEQAYKQEVIKTIKEVAVNGKGVFKQAVALNRLKQLKDGSSLAFRIFNSAGKDIQKVSNIYSNKLRISDSKELLKAYYTTGGGSILTKFMEYSQQVTLEIVTSNMVGEALDIELYQLIDWSITDWNGDTKAIAGTKQKVTVNSNGKAELQFTIENCWELDYAMKDKSYLEIIPKVNNQFYGGLSTNKNNYIYRLKISPEAEKLNAEKSPQSCNLVQIEKVAGSKEKKERCNNCDSDITLDEIRNVCADDNGKCLISEIAMITKGLPYLNQYRKKVGIDTCTRKAHFLAQLAAESKFYSLQENFNWYWKSLIPTFKSYFKQFKTQVAKETKAKKLGREEKDGVSLTLEEQKTLANAIYGSKHPIGKGAGHKEGDGWRYSGKGFKQITWKTNYKEVQDFYNEKMKEDTESDVSWIDDDNPYKLKNNAKDAMVSALAFWGWKMITPRANYADEYAVKSVTYRINGALKGLDERKRYFLRAKEQLKIEECPLYKGKKWQEQELGTVIIIAGKSYKYGESKKNGDKWPVYKTSVYRRMSLDKYKELKRKEELPEPDYITYLARDAHGKELGTNKYPTKSDYRHGRGNEVPSGEHYLFKKTKGQSYKWYLGDKEHSPYILDNEGGDSRGGIAIHGGYPSGAVGCLTIHSGVYKNNSLVNEFYANVPDVDNLKNEKNRDVIVIIEPREVKEIGNWGSGAIKYEGIVEENTNQ
ncbi:hypothetical protein J2Q11_13275, partial [Tenacibaculum finnmarkense genomovar finnmarkense]